jgi:hypothetical protein
LDLLVTVGAGNTWTIVNPLANMPELPSGFVTTTFLVPAVTPLSANEQVIWVEETTVTPVAGTSGLPVMFSLTIAPFINPVPVRFVMLTEVSLYPEAGAMLMTTGAAYETVM